MLFPKSWSEFLCQCCCFIGSEQGFLHVYFFDPFGIQQNNWLGCLSEDIL